MYAARDIHGRVCLVIEEHHLVVPRTARYVTLGAFDASVEQLWLVCHGYSQLASQFVGYFRTLDDGRRLIVAPEGLSRFYLDPASGGTHGVARVGASWMTREDRLHEIDDQLRYLDAVHAQVIEQLGREPAQCIVLGFSQGAATAARWVTRSAVRVDRLVLWGALLPPDLDLATNGARLARMHVTLVAGERDEYLSPTALASEQQRLEHAGVPCERMTFDGRHRLDKTVLGALGKK